MLNHLHAVCAQQVKEATGITDRGNPMHCRSPEALNRLRQRAVQATDLSGDEFEYQCVLLNGRQLGHAPPQHTVEQHLIDLIQPGNRFPQRPCW